MSKGINISVYKPILSVRDAWSFDFGTALMRIYTFMATIGSVTMFTLMGHSVLLSGSVSSCIALSTFLISPLVSKRIDERGQSRIIPGATTIALLGLVLMLCAASFGLPFWLNYVAAVAMGFIPNASAIARARWTYLVRALGKKHHVADVDIKTVFSYQGIIDDIAFAIGPAAAVALSAGFFPAAGLAFGGVCYVVGVVLLLSSKSTEPVPGWTAEEEQVDVSGADGAKAEDGAQGASNADEAKKPASSAKARSLFLENSAIRVLFFLMLGLGSLYGVLDTATVTFGQELGVMMISSLALSIQALVSIATGTIFGAMKLKQSLLRQWLAVCAAVGISYLFLASVRGVISFFVVICIGSMFYAPFLITLNTVCERCVDGSRLTEGITWITAGLTFGLAIGPTIAGVFIDKFGCIAGFNVAATFAALLLVIAFACIPVMRRKIG